jgi:hypothetical protein
MSDKPSSLRSPRVTLGKPFSRESDAAKRQLCPTKVGSSVKMRPLAPHAYWTSLLDAGCVFSDKAKSNRGGSCRRFWCRDRMFKNRDMPAKKFSAVSRLTFAGGEGLILTIARKT